MRTLFFVLFLGLVSLASAAYDIEEGVLVLTDANFDSAVAENSNILVEFYAPWCGHCKSLAPEYAKAAKALANAPVKLGKVDATEHKVVSQKFAIQGFPTLKFFKNGKPSDYSGGRTESEIVAWLNKKTGPVVTTLSTEEELLNFQEKNDAFVLGVFDSDSANAKAFTKLAENDETLNYAVTSSSALKEKLSVSDTVVVLKSFDEKRNDFPITGTFDEEAVSTFIAGASIPLIQEFSPDASKKIFGSPIKLHALFFTDKTAPTHTTIKSEFEKSATEFKGRILFVNVPASESRVLEFFGLKESDLPAFVLTDMTSPSALKKYPMSGSLEEATISAHINSYFDGTLKPSLKSEEIEPADTTGPVKILKGKSFADIVLNNDKDVLVEFYAPWCGHCKKLAPVWDKLGENFASNKNIVIAKMDSTANEVDVPGLAVSGFPTIYFFKGSDKTKPIKYEGSRELDGFIEYLEDNAAHPVNDEL